MQLDNSKILIQQIFINARKLEHIFLTAEELKKIQKSMDFFQARINNATKITLANLNWYQKAGWKKLIDEKNDIL